MDCSTMDSHHHHRDEVMIREALLHDLAAFHQDHLAVVDVAVDLIKEKGLSPQRLLNCRSGRGLYAFILWESLNRRGFAMSPRVVALTLDVPIQALLHAERELEMAPTYCSPEAYCERLCFEMGMAYWMAKHVVNGVKMLDNVMEHPECVVAGVMDYLREEIKSQFDLDLKRLHRCNIAQALGISISSIREMRKKLNHSCLEAVRNGVSQMELGALQACSRLQNSVNTTSDI